MQLKNKKKFIFVPVVALILSLNREVFFLIASKTCYSWYSCMPSYDFFLYKTSQDERIIITRNKKYKIRDKRQE